MEFFSDIFIRYWKEVIVAVMLTITLPFIRMYVRRQGKRMLNFFNAQSNNEPTDAQAQYELGLRYHSAKNFAQAVYCYRKAAEQGHANAQYMLGLMYDNGYGVMPDYEEARKWYRKAAEQGDTFAQSRLNQLS